MKGEVRNPTVVWLLAVFLCGIYGLYYIYTVNTELKDYLNNEEINPVVELIIGFLCSPFALMRLGAHVQEAQRRAGIADAEDQGVSFAIWSLICGLGFRKVQEELNRAWEAGGGAPATF
ncbi:MAG: DUF4234 domain-containing protein [Sandaracinaceae bacterium]